MVFRKPTGNQNKENKTKNKQTSLSINISIKGLSILDISKTIMYEFWYDYIKPKYRKKAQLCCMNTGSFMTHIIYVNNIITYNTWKIFM